ncbi:MAG: hypothetical protein JXA06_05250 [Bacteroidetes bacterium]|nr:hypothetical protein [Bacteroidota bacterium]
MSIYNVLSFEVPIIAYSVLHQPKKTVTAKEYARILHNFRSDLNNETQQIKSIWEGYISDITSKNVQATRGNLSQFLSTPIQSDTDDIQKILKDQNIQTSEQLLTNVRYGLSGGYDARYLLEAKQSEIPKTRIADSRSFIQEKGFKLEKNNNSIFESLYLVQGGTNLDILENIMQKFICNYNTEQAKKMYEPENSICSIYNLLFSDGVSYSGFDRFELQVNFVKGKEPCDIFNKELGESIKFFRTEIHHLNVSVWQRKLALGKGEQYILRILTKDRFTLHAAVSAAQKFAKDKHIIANAVRAGTWLTKEIM